jgi:hypothetical protein
LIMQQDRVVEQRGALRLHSFSCIESTSLAWTS